MIWRQMRRWTCHMSAIVFVRVKEEEAVEGKKGGAGVLLCNVWLIEMISYIT